MLNTNLPNYAFASNGGKLCYFSSETTGFPCENVIMDNENIWISEQKLPQELVIRIDNSNPEAKCVCLTGWFCHKRYIFNPKVVKLFIARQFNAEQPDQHFVHWATLTADDLIGTHYFKLKPIPNEYSFYKFQVVETFGGTRVYMNKIFLLREFPDFMKNEGHRDRADVMLKSPTFNVDVEKFSQRVISPIKQGTVEELSFAEPFDTPGPRKVLTFEKDRKLREAEDFISNYPVNANEQFTTKHGNHSNVNSLLLDHNMSAVSTNEISSSPLVSMSFHGMKGSDSFYRPAPRAGPQLMKTSAIVNTVEELHGPIRSRPKSSIESVLTKKQDAVQSSVPLVQNTAKSIADLEDRLNQLGEDVTKLTRSPSRSKKNDRKQSDTVDPQVQLLIQGMQECILKTKELQLNMKQISDRVSILEESNIVPLLHDHKNLAMELRRDVDDFKGKFSEKITTKLKKSTEQIEAKLTKNIEAYIQQVVDQRVAQLSKDMSVQIADTISRVRLVHPDNKKIDDYNEKVRFINKKTVATNNHPSTQPDMQMLYNLQKSFPTSIIPGDGEKYLTVAPSEIQSKPDSRPSEKPQSAMTAVNGNSMRTRKSLSGAIPSHSSSLPVRQTDDPSKKLSKMRRALKTGRPE